MHRMISWPLCRSAMKFSFFSVVNMCYKVRLYLLRMRKKLLYNMHRMVSWPLCRSPKKFSFFSVVKISYKVSLYCACARGCCTMCTEWSADPSADPPVSSPSSVWSTCATNYNYTGYRYCWPLEFLRLQNIYAKTHPIAQLFYTVDLTNRWVRMQWQKDRISMHCLFKIQF